MREEDRLTPAEAEFEAALRGLQPAGASIDRDQVMYRAGYAAGNRRSKVWQGVTVLLAASLGTLLAVRGLTTHNGSSQRNAQFAGSGPARSVTLAMKPESQSAHGVVQPTYLLLRNEVLQRGLAALPQSSEKTGGLQPVTLRDLLAEPSRVQSRESTHEVIQSGGRS